MLPPGESSENTPPSAAAPPPLPTPGAPVPSGPRKSRLPLIIGVGALLVAGTGGAVWIGLRYYEQQMHIRRVNAERTMEEILKKEGDHPTTAPIKPVKKPDPTPALPEAAPEAAPVPPVESKPKPPQVIHIPGDAATITEALKSCPEGGTIEVNGGTYRESLLITKPVTLLGSGGATLQDEGKSTTQLIAKGDIAVTIRGLTVRNAQKKGAGNPEESAALVLLASNAKVKLEQCVIEGGQGDALTVADHAEAELNGCRILKNRGFGIRISGSSKLSAVQTAIQENGLGGVWAANTGTRFALNEGATVNRNSNNGIQATEGAVVEINGGGVSFNSVNGIIALDAGTNILVKESGLISDNANNGLAMVNGATATISSAKVERNKNYGVNAEHSGKLSISGGVFRSNAMAGVFFDEGDGQSCRIEHSEFYDHSEFGVAVVNADLYVSNCTFSENGGAVLLGKSAKGTVTGNTISPGPLSEAIQTEGAGEVKKENNTIR